MLKKLYYLNLFFYLFFITSPSLFYYINQGSITPYLPFFISLQILLITIPLPVFQIKYKTYVILLIPFFILSLCHWANFSVYRFELAEGAMLSIIATNINETYEFLKLIPNYYFIFLSFIVLNLCFLLIAQQPKNRLKNKTTVIFIITIVIIVAPKFYKSYKDGIDVLKLTFPARNITYIHGAYELYTDYQDDLQKMDGADYSVSTPEENLKSIHVLVIGESARRKNFSLYGYKRDTNPLLMSKRKELTIFDNIYSASNSTVMSLRWSLSKKVGKQVITIPKLFQKAGFQSIWLSNQGQFGENLNATSALALTAEEAIFINNSDFGSMSYDERLVPILKEKTTNENAQFIVLHLLGSHFHYNRRYPQSFNQFKSSPPRTDQLKAEQIKIINEYDNSILYTDFILSNIINHLKTIGRPVTLTYFSDHGEILYDGDAESYGHGGGKHPTEEELKIPFLFWANNQYYELFKNKKSFLETMKSKKFSTVDFVSFYTTLLDIQINDIQLPEIDHNQIYFYNSRGSRTLFEEK